MAADIRAGRVLCRCHAALGEQEYSVAALEAALDAARAGQLVFSESLCVRSRALVGKAASAHNASGSAHWSEAQGRQRVLEVVSIATT